ncbi:unnamed protein product, partial [Laminaria digitata]
QLCRCQQRHGAIVWLVYSCSGYIKKKIGRLEPLDGGGQTDKQYWSFRYIDPRVNLRNTVGYPPNRWAEMKIHKKNYPYMRDFAIIRGTSTITTCMPTLIHTPS